MCVYSVTLRAASRAHPLRAGGGRRFPGQRGMRVEGNESSVLRPSAWPPVSAPQVKAAEMSRLGPDRGVGSGEGSQAGWWGR